MSQSECALVEQGFIPGSCGTLYKGRKEAACRVTLKWKGDTPYRLIKSAHLSRPEHYFSIYQSGCNFSCKKCHSWEFTLRAQGKWMSPRDIARLADQYAEQVTYYEPRERATSFHALDLCRGCGACVELVPLQPTWTGRPSKYSLRRTGRRSPLCPGKLEPEQIILSPQGFGPARNIIAFTGGDLACQPEFYARSTELIKGLDRGLWVLFETNGYGLTPRNLDLLKSAGVDSFWLDIKAWDEEVHKRLTGASNRWILRLPEGILKRGFVLEVLSLFIPGWVEANQLAQIASLLAAVDPNIPFTLLAFFPQNELRHVAPPSLEQMLEAYQAVKEKGLRQVRMGNLGVFVRKEEDMQRLLTSAADGI